MMELWASYTTSVSVYNRCAPKQIWRRRASWLGVAEDTPSTHRHTHDSHTDTRTSSTSADTASEFSLLPPALGLKSSRFASSVSMYCRGTPEVHSHVSVTT